MLIWKDKKGATSLSVVALHGYFRKYIQYDLTTAAAYFYVKIAMFNPEWKFFWKRPHVVSPEAYIAK